MKGFDSPDKERQSVRVSERSSNGGGQTGARHTLTGDHVRDLDDGIDRCLWKDSLPTGTLDVETEDPKRCERRPVSFRRMRNQILGPDEGRFREAEVSSRSDTLQCIL